MKILFSPSETKYKNSIPNSKFTKDSFIFPELFDKRMEIINKYKNFIQNANNDELSKLFGTKKEHLINHYKTDILTKPIQKVILRYDGIAYNYLKYHTLKPIYQEYIDKNVLIFSNLFGILKAGDIGIPEYKLKQGEKLGNFVIEKFYKEHFSKAIDNYLQDEDLVDLRAGFYEKFYTIKQPYITMKFLKNGKVVSHWAKAYRGIVLQQMAINNIKSIDELLQMEIENLQIHEIQKQKFKTNIIYTIL